MGFSDVYDYAAGEADWIAMGLPIEHRDTRPRVEQVARRDAPTCGVQDRVEHVRTQLPSGWNVCVVLNADRIVLGLADLSEKIEPDRSIEERMHTVGVTFREGVAVGDGFY